MHRTPLRGQGNTNAGPDGEVHDDEVNLEAEGHHAQAGQQGAQDQQAYAWRQEEVNRRQRVQGLKGRFDSSFCIETITKMWYKI